MADYIDRNILCQAYIHVELEHDISDAELANLKRHLEAYIATRGQFFLYEDIATDVEIRDGSLKLYLTFAGALYIAIGQYGSFRDGVNFLAQDAKRLADCAVSESLFLTRSRHDNTIRAESRVGVVGSLKSSIDKLHQISAEIDDTNIDASVRSIDDVHEHIGKLIGNLRDPADTPFVAKALCEIVRAVLPSRVPHPRRRQPTEVQAVAYRRARSELIGYLESVSR